MIWKSLFTIHLAWGGVSQVSVTVKLYNKSQHGGREEEGGAIKHDKQPQFHVL